MTERQSIITIQSRGYTSRKGYAAIDEVLGNCATLYNAALQHRRDAWKQAGESVSYYDQCKELTGLRQEDPYWAGISLQVARGTINQACSEILRQFLSQGAPRRNAGLSALQPALSVQDYRDIGGVPLDAEGSR